MILPQPVREWLHRKQLLLCLLDEKHYKNTEPEFLLPLLYSAIIMFQREHRFTRVKELKGIVRQMCQYLIDHAENKQNLFLLSGPEPLITTLTLVKKLHPKVKEVDMAIDLFGDDTVMPMYCMFELLGVNNDARIPDIRFAYQLRVRELKLETKQVPTSFYELVKANAKNELLHFKNTIAQKTKDKKKVSKALENMLANYDKTMEKIATLLSNISETKWEKFMFKICHSLRNIALEFASHKSITNIKEEHWAMLQLVFDHCPSRLHYMVKPHFTEPLHKGYGLRQLQILSK